MKTELLIIDVKILEPYTVSGHRKRITMLPFTGIASGPFFTGHTIGPGVDTQTFIPSPGDQDGSEEAHLSARYMLEGTDYTGQTCRIFIDNSKHDEAGWHPVIVTDSEALAEWEGMNLVAKVEPAEDGVQVRIYHSDSMTDNGSGLCC